MSINLVTYANQTVTPTNDAIIYEKAVDQNGIFYGCNVTVSGNNVNITGGYGIVCGREFVIESESIPVTLAPSVPLDGRLYVRLDLADADNPIQLLTAQGGTLPALEQDANVNFVNGVWEMELATFTVGVSALSDVVETFETIKGVAQLANDIASSKVGVVEFNLTGYAGFDNAFGVGKYDIATDTVRLYCYGTDSANLPTNTALFTVPAEYKPPGNVALLMPFSGTGGAGMHYAVLQSATGEITQNGGNTLRTVLIFGEYKVHSS